MAYKSRRNLFEMYIANKYKFGFLVGNKNWPPGNSARVISIGGVEEGKPIEGDPPYYHRSYPPGQIGRAHV